MPEVLRVEAKRGRILRVAAELGDSSTSSASEQPKKRYRSETFEVDRGNARRIVITHMAGLNEFVDWALTTVNLPGFRLAAFLLSLVSVGISIWAFRRTKAVLDAHEKSILSDQIRFSNSEWQKVGRFVLGDEKYLGLAAETFGFASVDDARRTYFYFLYLNPAFCSFQAFKLGIMDRNVFGGGLRSVIHNFKGDGAELLNAIKLLGYPDDFAALCKQLLAQRDTPKETRK